MFGRLAVVVLFLAAGAARAQERRLAVVPLVSPPTMVGLAAQVAREVEGAARAQGWQVVGPEAVAEALGEEGLQAVQECKGQAACVAERVRVLGTSRAVVGRLERDARSYLLQLSLVDVRKGEEVATVDRAILIASRRFASDVKAAVPPFLQGKKEPRGTLVLSASVPNVQVEVNGEPAGKAPVTLTLKPGKHQVRLSKANYYPVERWVAVEAEGTTREEVRMTLEPNRVDPDVAPPAVARASASPGPEAGVAAAAPAAAVSRGPSTRQVAGAFLGAGLMSGLAAAGLTVGLETAVGSSVRNTVRARNVALGLSGGALVLSGVLFLLGGEEEAPAVGLSPAVAPGLAGAVLQGRF